MNTTNIYCLFYFILCTDPGFQARGAHLRKLRRAEAGANIFGVFRHFVSPLEIHNLYFGKHNKGDKSYKFMLQVANFHS